MVPKAGFRNQFLHQICELGVELVPALFAHYFCVTFVPFLWWHVGGTPGGTLVKFCNLYNKSARKNEASLHGSLRPMYLPRPKSFLQHGRASSSSDAIFGCSCQGLSICPRSRWGFPPLAAGHSPNTCRKDKLGFRFAFEIFQLDLDPSTLGLFLAGC